MPTYEYRCRECGEQLEAVQAFTDGPLTDCPTCGGALRKLFGSVGISFKGSGFYRNDSRSKAPSYASSSNGDKNGDKDKASTSASEPSPSSTSPSSDSSSGSGSKDSSSTAAATSA